MFIDKDLIFSDAQDISQTAAAYDSTNILDFEVAGDPIEPGLYLYVKLDAAVVGSGASVAFALHTSTDNFSASDVTLYDTGAIAVASLTLNAEIIKIPLPFGVLRYLKMVYTISGATTTAGTVFAAVVGGVDKTHAVS